MKFVGTLKMATPFSTQVNSRGSIQVVKLFCPTVFNKRCLNRPQLSSVILRLTRPNSIGPYLASCFIPSLAQSPDDVHAQRMCVLTRNRSSTASQKAKFGIAFTSTGEQICDGRIDEPNTYTIGTGLPSGLIQKHSRSVVHGALKCLCTSAISVLESHQGCLEQPVPPASESL